MKLHVLLLMASEVLPTGLRCAIGGVVNGLSVFGHPNLNPRNQKLRLYLPHRCHPPVIRVAHFLNSER
jgi:hypothetical protein